MITFLILIVILFFSRILKVSLVDCIPKPDSFNVLDAPKALRKFYKTIFISKLRYLYAHICWLNPKIGCTSFILDGRRKRQDINLPFPTGKNGFKTD